MTKSVKPRNPNFWHKSKAYRWLKFFYIYAILGYLVGWEVDKFLPCIFNNHFHPFTIIASHSMDLMHPYIVTPHLRELEARLFYYEREYTVCTLY